MNILKVEYFTNLPKPAIYICVYSWFCTIILKAVKNKIIICRPDRLHTILKFSRFANKNFEKKIGVFG